MGSLSRRAFLTRAAAGAAGLSLLRSGRSVALSLLPAFTSGVARGDPSTDGVVLWTRVDPAHHGKAVRWEVLDGDDVLQHGVAVVDGDHDGTIHVPVSGLPAGTSLRYRFSLGSESIEATTKTLPSDPSSLRIGVVSCSKYSDGWYNAYRELAGMDCDLVLHLGDYIYASGAGDRDPLNRWGTVRPVTPAGEATTLAAYRQRYQQYRADPDLQALHASVPVVAIWDDNDIANNSFKDGDQAGERGEVWQVRKRDGILAWSEYHPTRASFGDDPVIWRRIQSGDLLDLLMLDTRLQRDEQVSNAAATSSSLNDDPGRSMLGAPQRAWLTDALTTSNAAWRVIGQGIVMAHWRVVGYPQEVGRALGGVPLVRDQADAGVYWNSDGWDGYAYERDRLFETFGRSGDVIVLTGDVHSSWANELVPDADPVNAPVGVEFVAPAVSTRPFSSNVSGVTPPFEAAFTAANPWIKQCDMDANGFLVVDLDADRAIGRWFKVDAQTRGATASPLMSWVTERGSRRLLPFLG